MVLYVCNLNSESGCCKNVCVGAVRCISMRRSWRQPARSSCRWHGCMLRLPRRATVYALQADTLSTGELDYINRGNGLFWYINRGFFLFPFFCRACRKWICSFMIHVLTPGAKIDISWRWTLPCDQLTGDSLNFARQFNASSRSTPTFFSILHFFPFIYSTGG